jgi:hypothetical protein
MFSTAMKNALTYFKNEVKFTYVEVEGLAPDQSISTPKYVKASLILPCTCLEKVVKQTCQSSPLFIVRMTRLGEIGVCLLWVVF